MYTVFVQIELVLLLFLCIFSWIAGVKASRLLYSRNRERMHRKASKLLFWSWFLAVPAAAIGGVAFWMQQSFDPLFWQDRLFIHAPLVLLPIAGIWLMAVPKLWKLRKMTGSQADPADIEASSLDASVYQKAAEPGLVVPFQIMALGALTALYFALVPPIPFQWIAIAVPAALFLAASAGLWWRHALRCKQIGKLEVYTVPALWKRALTMTGVLAVCAAAIAFLIDYGMKNSHLPAELNMASGVAEYGNGTSTADMSTHQHHMSVGGMNTTTGSKAKLVSVTDLTGPRTGTPDRQFTLTAQKQTVQLSSGKMVDAWTYNGQIPGTELRMKEGELVEVTLVNQDIEQGVTLHWHGLDVPNAEDGVAGATQNAVMPGETYTYRFRAEQVGTFWYHSHQVSQEAVNKGLFGALIVEPKEPKVSAPVQAERQAEQGQPAQSVQPARLQEKDITVLTHVWKNAGFALGASDTVERMTIAPGTPVRMRLINTDDWVTQKYTLVGTHFEVAAIDGTSLNKPDVLANTHLELTTGGRYDITFVMPEHPVFLSVGGKQDLGVFMTPDGQGDIPVIPATVPFNALHYGQKAATPFDENSKFTREFTMILDNKLGFYNGNFDFLYTLNGEVFPNTPMFMVKEGDLVKTTIVNRGSVEHPMHLHGHHVLVLSHNGKPSTGTPWWSDTLDVRPGDTYEVAFIANNPGLWMDHCHNLTHAAAGMTMHLMYEGITTPFSVGSSTHNHPE
ncbi:multicopper oxidase family protein [Paenibacillus sedimenti]|uniref:multicopper oxidase family protein n=1 Tax=Paenibacillus sedimenti TaxID=2770274 RepID=UPI001CB70D74|nr:multicopper oxidase domain-containing protein [Paenibacillus sedimenti]